MPGLTGVLVTMKDSPSGSSIFNPHILAKNVDRRLHRLFGSGLHSKPSGGQFLLCIQAMYWSGIVCPMNPWSNTVTSTILSARLIELTRSGFGTLSSLSGLPAGLVAQSFLNRSGLVSADKVKSAPCPSLVYPPKSPSAADSALSRRDTSSSPLQPSTTPVFGM